MLGLPHAIEVTTIDVTDQACALKAITRSTSKLRKVTSVLADGGYSNQSFAIAISEKLVATVQITKSATNCIPSK
jgi:hypothetical protein